MGALHAFGGFLVRKAGGQPYENFQVGPVCRVDFANRQKFLLKTVFPEHPLIFQPLAYLQRVQTLAAAVVGVEEGFFLRRGRRLGLGLIFVFALKL
ncbi:hypothetical protein, partial [Acidiferrobacter sp.]|uniref:hypothetical protein n=1 Tax=Acidiferrobacter sp. TaxID=1872107 RepID=UPI002633D66C